MGEQERERWTRGERPDRPAAKIEDVRRRIHQIVQQIEDQDSGARRAALEGEIVSLGGSVVTEELPAFRAVIEQAGRKPHADEAAYLETLAKSITDFFNEHFTAEELEAKARKQWAERSRFIALNESLAYGLSRDRVHIHVAPSETMPIGTKLRLMRDGLRELARRLEEDEALREVKEVTATSWIVAAHPGILEKLGFTFDGPIDEEKRRRDFAGETRPISTAHMDRDEFVKRYG